MPKLQEKGIEGIEMVTFIDYVPTLDAVLMGNASSSAIIISNFFSDCLGLETLDERRNILKANDTVEEIVELKPGSELGMSSKEKMFEEERQKILKTADEE
eukprot:CAMPEP_0202944160 /NCGR_PEP_ID=MMETSP1395-20130829/4862_1 /ASSEMBLY_ACC=CAM_ASM_000871 /TAXON_ID=5961 /ORGANISM="Blepharisma japonicum, Strain Stock R1072" /LENGTH=100 /DNA_ID=CAMNT_0049642585 /DNA_START=926 /DNA_END=1225 /DNA_ORIENTATION=+